ncbi:hypothetical protein ABW21_db0209297 [Orbilia brochopaga]|nr:hypothetical protein ABW21_db0209297 [Drechslerella brochopaga]
MKGKASNVMASTSKEKGKAPMSQTTGPPRTADQKPSQIVSLSEPPATTSSCDSASPEAPISPPPSSLDVLRWESKLDQQCPNSDSDSDSDCSDPYRKALRVPWPFKEYALSTRDGRTSYSGFCAYCGGSLSYRTSVTIHDMMDVLVGSMDDPEQAMRDIGFLAEFHCDLAGSIEDGARLGTQAGHARDEKVVRVHGCDWEPYKRRLFPNDRDKATEMEFEEEFIDDEMIYDETT